MRIIKESKIKMAQTDIEKTPSSLNEFDETSGYTTVIFVGQSKKDNSCILIFPDAEDDISKMGTFSDWKSCFKFLGIVIADFVKSRMKQQNELNGG